MPVERSKPIPEDLLSHLYETLVEPEALTRAVREAADWVGGTQAALQVRQLAPTLTLRAVITGLDEEFEQAYRQHYFRLDPHLRHAATLPEGETLFSRDVLPDEQFLQSSYYNDYLRPQGVRDLLGVMLLREGDLAASFATLSPISLRFEAEHRRRLRQLVPHLSRIIRLRLEQERRDEAHAGLQLAQSALRAALLQVDCHLTLVHSEGDVESALSATRGALELQNGALRARPDLSEALTAAVVRAFEGHATRFSPPQGAEVTLLIAPGGRDQGLLSRRVVNVILMPRPALGLDFDECPQLAALPPSLRRVASLMALGASDKEIAVELGMSLQSARTYAARVLKRLGFQSRRQLILEQGRSGQRAG